MKNFNFYHFLESKGYKREIIRKKDGTFMFNNYQKEVSENTWNCITVHDDKTISVASPKDGLFLIRQPQPTTEEEALELIKKAELF